MTRFGRPLLWLVAILWLLTACGSTEAEDSDGSSVPQVVMTDAQVGVAVWPSGARWIVLATDDGWRTVENRTPLAVPTDGGLVLSARGHATAVGVLPHELLTVSPVLQSSEPGGRWWPSQLPGGLLASPGSIALSDGAAWAVLDDHGEVVTETAGTTTWRPATSAQDLDGTGQLAVTGISFPDGRTGFVLGSGPSDGHVLFVRVAGGRSWQPVPLPLTGDGTAAAMAPCHVDGTWVAPILMAGRLQLFSAPDPAGPWAAGSSLPAPTTPVVACGPGQVWAAVPNGASDVLAVASVTGPWASKGDLGTHILSLSVASPTTAYAATDDRSVMISITLSSEAATERIELPRWTATLGGEEMRD